MYTYTIYMYIYDMRIYKIAGESWKERIMMEIFTARTFLTNKSIRKVTGMPNQPDT